MTVLATVLIGVGAVLGVAGVELALMGVRADGRAAADDRSKPFLPTDGEVWREENLQLLMRTGQTETDVAFLNERWAHQITSGLRNRKWAAWLSLFGIASSAIGGVLALVK